MAKKKKVTGITFLLVKKKNKTNKGRNPTK